MGYRRRVKAFEYDDTMWDSDMGSTSITVFEEGPKDYFTGLVDENGDEIWYIENRIPMGFHHAKNNDS